MMGPAIMAVAMVVSAAGAAASGVAASHQAEYQAQVAKNNAALADKRANMIMEDAANKSMEKGLQDKALMGKMAAGLASSNVDVNTGSAKGVLASEQQITKMGQHEYMRAVTAGDWWSAKQQQVSALGEAELQKSKAEAAEYAAAVGATSSLLSGASKGNEKYGWFGG